MACHVINLEGRNELKWPVNLINLPLQKTQLIWQPKEHIWVTPSSLLHVHKPNQENGNTPFYRGDFKKWSNTRNSTRHKCRARCGDVQTARPSGQSLWTWPNRTSLRNSTARSEKMPSEILYDWIMTAEWKSWKGMKRSKISHISRSRLMSIPKDIGLNHIQASIFSRLNQPFPHLIKRGKKKQSL